MKITSKSSKSQSSTMSIQKNDLQASSKLIKINLQSIINLYDKTDKYFSKTIQKQVTVMTKSKQNLEIQTSNNNQQNKNIGYLILQEYQKINKYENNMFFFEQGQRQIIFLQGIKLIADLIGKFNVKTGYKKNVQIKRFLTKLLLELGRFLVKKIFIKEKNSDFNNYMNKLYEILIIDDTSRVVTESMTKVKGRNRQIKRNLHFQVPLLMSNKKIDYTFYLILKMFQKQLIQCKNTNLASLQKAVQKLCQQVSQFLNILIKHQKHQVLSNLIKSICNCLDCMDLPVCNIFFGQIYSLIQHKFAHNYINYNSNNNNNNNNSNNDVTKMSRQVFSLCNIELLIKTILKIENNSYSSMIVESYLGQSQNELDKRNIDNVICRYCDIATDKFISICLKKNIFNNNNNNNNNKYSKFHINICSYCIQQIYGQQITSQQFFHSLIYNYNFQNILLLPFIYNIYSRQQYQLQQIKLHKQANNLWISFLTGENGIINVKSIINNRRGDNDEEKIKMWNMIRINGFGQRQDDINNKKNHKKGKNVKNINKQQQQVLQNKYILNHILKKILSILIAFINSNNQSIRIQTFILFQQKQFTNIFHNYISFSQFQHLFQQQQSLQQSTQLSFHNKNNNKSLLSLLSQLHYKLIILLKQSINRLNDSSNQVKLQVMKFLFIINQKYLSIKVNQEIYGRVIKIVQNNVINYQYFKTINYVDENNLNSNKGGQYTGYYQIFNVLIGKILLYKNNNHIIQSSIKIISKLLSSIFTCLNIQNRQKIHIFDHQQTIQIVQNIKKLLKRINKLFKQQQQNNNTLNQNSFQVDFQNNNTKKNNNLYNYNYKQLIFEYLNRFYYTKQTIKCFKIEESLLEEIINNNQLLNTNINDKNTQYKYDDNYKQQILLTNIKLIFQQVFHLDIMMIRQENNNNNNKCTKKRQNKINKNKQEDNENTQHNHSNSYKNTDNKDNRRSQILISCDLNKIIKTLILSHPQPNFIVCQILTILLRKNYSLNFPQFSSSINNNKYEIIRFLNSSQNISSLKHLLKHLQKQISQCHIDQLQQYIKLYIIICKQLNQQSSVEKMFMLYRRFYQVKKGKYCFQGGNVIKNQQEKKRCLVFMIRAIKTVSKIVLEYEKYKIIEIRNQQTKNQYKDYYFLELTRIVYDLLDRISLLKDKQIMIKQQTLISCILQLLSNMLTVHPQILKGTQCYLICFSQIKFAHKKTYQMFLLIFQTIQQSKNSQLMSLLPRIYQNIKHQYLLLFNNMTVEQDFNIIQRFYQITCYLLTQDIISIHEVSSIIYFGTIVENKNVNLKIKEYLRDINAKGIDNAMFINFQKSIIQCLMFLQKNNVKFVNGNDKMFRNVYLFCDINKVVEKKNKVLFVKDLKEIKIRSTFVKKIAQLLQIKGRSLNRSQQSYLLFFFIFKLFQSISSMDIFQFQQLLFTLQRFIKQHYLQLFNHKSSQQYQQNQQQQLQRIIYQSLQINQLYSKIYSILIIGQCLYLLIGLLNQRKLKKVKKQVQSLIEKKKFNNQSINVKVNQFNWNNQINEKNNYNNLRKYQSCSKILAELKIIQENINGEDNLNKKQQLISLLIRGKQLTQKMYNIVFNDQSPKYTIQPYKNQQKRKKKINKKRIYQGQSDSDDDIQSQNSQFSDISSISSMQHSSTNFSKQSLNKQTKKYPSTNKPLTKKSDSIQTKRIISTTTRRTRNRKILSHSLPKKIQRHLSIIDENNQNYEENNMDEFVSSRRSKRLINRKNMKIQLNLDQVQDKN